MDLKDKGDITSISLRWLFNKSPRMPGTLTMLESIHEISPHGQENAFFTNPNSGNFLNGLSIKGLLIKEATTDAMDKVIVWLKYRV